jgi:heme exporter protein A
MIVLAANLSVARGGVTVLSGLTFSVGAGQAVVLRGPNGSGKTTLLRTLAGLQPPVGGSLDLNPDAVAYAAHADGLRIWPSGQRSTVARPSTVRSRRWTLPR